MFVIFINEHFFKHYEQKGSPKMNERQKRILEILYERGRVSVAELSRTLYVAEMTVRRDLIEMEKGGYLRRYRGGAVMKIDLGEMPISERLLLDQDEKKELAKRCLPYLHDGMTVFLDSSSTCQYLIPHLATLKKITLLTNSVSTLLTASGLHLPSILIGGEYYEQDMCMVGSLAEEAAGKFNVDIAFFATAAISADGVISDFDLRQTAIRKIVMQNAKQSVFLFERDKYGKKLLYTLCRAEEATAVITADNA